jgi:hypothetical protein
MWNNLIVYYSFKFHTKYSSSDVKLMLHTEFSIKLSLFKRHLFTFLETNIRSLTMYELCTVKHPSVSEATAKNKRIWKNNSCVKVIYMGDIQGPEKMNDICLKTMHAATMDRDFTALCPH